ncbi:MAG TPA: ABC transporter permease, partial [Rhodothermales bacterium]
MAHGLKSASGGEGRAGTRGAFRGFVIKEFHHILRDRRTLLVLFGMPIVMMILFGFAIRNEIEDIKIAIVDQSKDNITREIIDRLLASPYFRAADVRTSMAGVEDSFQRGAIKEAVIFEPQF